MLDDISSSTVALNSVELYGSMSMEVKEPERGYKKEWPLYYVNTNSDVDFVVEVGENTKSEAITDALISRLVADGQCQGAKIVSRTRVHKFASTQFTLNIEVEENGEVFNVPLDLTCIDSHAHFERFRQRQLAFQAAFSSARSRLEAQFKARGAAAFDAYIHLLKAFAAKVPGNALTGFQAACLGLFALSLGVYKPRRPQSIAMTLFESFLQFC